MSIKVSKNKVSQTIDLKELFDVDFRGKRALREAIAQRLIDRMLERFDDGKGIKFTGRGASVYDLSSVPYSPKYKNSLQFKAFGKNKNDVTLKLTGEMRDAMGITKQKSNEITLGFIDTVERKKAYAHTVGKQKDATVKVPARPFFGLSKDELNEIKKEFKPAVQAAVKETGGRGSAFELLALQLIDDLTKEAE